MLGQDKRGRARGFRARHSRCTAHPEEGEEEMFDPVNNSIPTALHVEVTQPSSSGIIEWDTPLLERVHGQAGERRSCRMVITAERRAEQSRAEQSSEAG